MKKLLLIAVLFSSFSSLLAQQDAHYTNFMFNKLALNPAYAGSREAGSLMALYRNQWVGMEGAPNTQTLTFHTPMWKEKVGLGIMLERDALTFFQNYKASMAYTYRFKLGPGKLGIGVQGSVKNVRVNWDMARPLQLNDAGIPLYNANKFVPNFGAGLYYHTKNWYAGLSMPSLLNNSLDFGGNPGDLFVARERRHLFGMGGVVLPISSKVKINPNVLLKYVENSPFDMDLNLSFIFVDKLTIGATYRMGDSFDALLHWNLTPQLRLGVGYDYTLSELQQYNSGSFEVLLGYDFIYRNSSLENPRFF
jgi:type IX secretion system PorP/SprF family membrane protein